MAGSLKKKPGMGMDKEPSGKALPGKKKKRVVKPAKLKKAY